LWAYAHYGQFSAAGWHYLKGGSGDLDGGGTYVTLQSPGADYSIILETSGAKAAQTIRFATGGGLSKAASAVWRSTAAEQFVRQPDIAPRDGVVAVTLEPNAVYSLTTTRGQQKGSFGEAPAAKPFPFPYRETFDGYSDRKQWGSLPGYFADISGAFELAACPTGTGGCLRQMAPVPTLSWAPDWQPSTIIGDDRWRDYEVSADIYLHPGESAGVMGRITDVGTGYGFIPKGYILQLDAAGQLRLTVVRGKADKKALVGDAEQQALIRTQNDASEGGEKLLASAQLPTAAAAAGAWHRLTLRFDGTRIAGLLDGTQVLAASDGLYASGMAGLLAGRVGDRLCRPYYDDFVVKQARAPAPDARSVQSGRGRIYPSR
jgi:galactosylceramidase